ncbi:MAG TPA: response regulator [Candidatus Acidoferrales bacterium]|nr:response regulator [Candidatus Acidoferrales bacterium]
MTKILIVDDDVQSRQLYVSLLTPFGHQVLEARDGREGLEMAKREKPDLIISDILMPTMNGYEFVTAVRKEPSLKKIPIIFHSASFLDREARALGESCGVSLYILKPCDPEKILEVVHAALGTSIELPFQPPTPPVERATIPLLLDAFFEKGEKLNASTARLSALLELAIYLAGPRTVNHVLTQAAASAREILGSNYAALGLLDEEGVKLESFALSGVSAEIVSRMEKESFKGRVFQDIIHDMKSHVAYSPFGNLRGLDLPSLHPPVRSFLGTRLELEDRVYGWIYVAEKLASLEFDDQDAKVLEAIAAQTALACENVRRYRKIQEHAAKLETEIAERKRAEDRFRMLVESAPSGIIIVDGKGRIVDANPHAIQLFGYDRKELVGQTVDMLVPSALRAAHEKHRSSFAASHRARPMGLGMELFARRKDGTEFPVEISLGPLVTEGETLVSASIVDISARRKMEQQLRISQRVEAIGRLAGGVAHDFNNLLTVILGSCDALADELPADHTALRRLELVKKAASSAADLTRQLLAFGRKQILQPRIIESKEIVSSIGGLLKRLIGENIDFKVSVDPSAGCINADYGQIEQILVNLVTNARDAMPDGGRLEVEVANADLDEAYKDTHPPVVPGSYVMIAVADTGKGMSRETQAQIFDPFFTTKEIGKGSGLGLATVYGIVKQSGGYIWVYSEPDKGSVFKIYLPRVKRAELQQAPVELDRSAQLGTEVILLAEDSEALREIAGEYLASLGYTVIEAASGTEALSKSSEFPGKIDLLLTDVVMPEMDGRKLADEIAQKRPGIKVLFSSGYTDDAIVRHGVLEPGVYFIQKPYRPKALARKVREVLNNCSNQSSSIKNNSSTGGVESTIKA